MFEAKIIAHSISEQGKEIITYQLKYPRFIHAEFMTHRLFSRNASSSRAIPVAKMIEQVRTNPAMPIHWGANQPGMQADMEVADIDNAKDLWRTAAANAADLAEAMMEGGLHKQVANRILEPFQWISVVVTATEWDNFHALRSHKDAQPEIKLLSDMMLEARAKSTPKLLETGEWHLPYIYLENDFVEVSRSLKKEDIYSEGDWYAQIYEILKKVSAARCARVSYLTHDGKPTTVEADLALCERLAGTQPIHASPFEHQATPDEMWSNDGDINWLHPELHGNFVGWIQHRKLLPNENISK